MQFGARIVHGGMDVGRVLVLSRYDQICLLRDDIWLAVSASLRASHLVLATLSHAHLISRTDPDLAGALYSQGIFIAAEERVLGYRVVLPIVTNSLETLFV